MSTNRHDRSAVESFLDRDFRQVWAVDRVTGEPHYLPVGEADALRKVAKREWRCPVPGCEVEISTRGKSRRDHFFHVGTAPHTADGESEAHLAGKAMLADWARAKLPPACLVKEEETIKDHNLDLHRIADVMVTWEDGSKTSFEVEYKPFTEEAWTAKQADYDSVGIPCAWILGHTRISAVPERSWGVGDWSNAVRVPHLGLAFAKWGRHILVINPTEKLIGTLSADRDATTRLGRYDYDAWLNLDPIDDCEIDPILGIITPSMRRIDAATERRAGEAIRAQEADKRRDEALDGKRARIEGIKQQQSTVWDESDLKRELTERWGSIPTILTKDTRAPWGIWANPTHWHAVLYETLVHDQPANSRFAFNTIEVALARHGIQRHRVYKTFFSTTMSFLEQLEDAHLLTIHRDHQGRIHHLSPSGHNIEDLPRINEEKAEAKRLAALRRADDLAAAQEEHNRDTERRKDDDQNAQQRRLDRWQTSGIRATTLKAFDDSIPDFIAWSAVTDEERSIDAIPAHWHALVYMTHIHDQPPGTAVAATDATCTLKSASIIFTEYGEQANQAVRDYLYNLRQRGHLAQGAEPDTYIAR